MRSHLSSISCYIVLFDSLDYYCKNYITDYDETVFLSTQSSVILSNNDINKVETRHASLLSPSL